MSNLIDKKISALEKERDTKIKKINAECEAAIKKLTEGMVKDDLDDDYCYKFDFKKNTVVTDKNGMLIVKTWPCNKWTKKEDWIDVEIEDYDVYLTWTDAGYGDGDTYAMFRIVSTYRVCPACGRMVNVKTEKLEHGLEKTRWEEVPGFDIRPAGWRPKIKVLRRKGK